MRARRALALVAAVVVLAACAGGGGATGSTPPSPKPSPTSPYLCSGDQYRLWSNGNGGAVDNGGGSPTFDVGDAVCLNMIETYHYNGGQGVPPGPNSTLWIVDAAGKTIAGPYVAKGSPGQDGPNENWYAYVPNDPPLILKGSYSCHDSQPATWSSNKDSGGAGFCTIWAKKLVAR
jgi:hypothetical protein